MFAIARAAAPSHNVVTAVIIGVIIGVIVDVITYGGGATHPTTDSSSRCNEQRRIRWLKHR
jgi:hypothetical protein